VNAQGLVEFASWSKNNKIAICFHQQVNYLRQSLIEKECLAVSPDLLTFIENYTLLE
jgi:N-acetylglutamate synthase-like GNAT family acetyltransferase